MKPFIHLEIGADSSTYFLRTWQAWRADAQRPHMLHVVVVCSSSYSNQTSETELKPLAQQLDTQLWGLLPGFHRLVFEGGQVQLTLCIGNIAKLLRQQQFAADFIDLKNAALVEPDTASAADPIHLAKALARLCKPGTRLTLPGHHDALQAAFKQCGFIFGGGKTQATYNPAWLAKTQPQPIQPSTCLVVGAGLAGAAVASSLARRGWAVTVLDSASQPASGASGLPAGLLVPHTSPDDSLLSRLSRSGVRTTLEQAQRLLVRGVDWAHTGVLERSLDGVAKTLPFDELKSTPKAASDWCSTATPEQLTSAGLPAGSTALWHAPAGWIQPAALVKAWLATPGVNWCASALVAELKPSEQGWQVLSAAGIVLAEAQLVVLASGFATQALAAQVSAESLQLQAIRGQVLWALQGQDLKLPAFPINGNGSLIPNAVGAGGAFWLAGSTYERDAAVPLIKSEDSTQNYQRLQSLHPGFAAQVANTEPGQLHTWAGVRCATPTRLPVLGRLATADAGAGVWVCSGMGSRGLTFAALCAELLAAQLHREPLPIEHRLAKAITL